MCNETASKVCQSGPCMPKTWQGGPRPGRLHARDLLRAVRRTRRVYARDENEINSL